MFNHIVIISKVISSFEKKRPPGLYYTPLFSRIFGFRYGVGNIHRLHVRYWSDHDKATEERCEIIYLIYTFYEF